MNILLLGSGGRESALAWKIAASTILDKLFIAPGNAGTEKYGTNVDMKPTDFKSIKKFVLEHKINFVVVGPEDPLVLGIHDFFLQDRRKDFVSTAMAMQDVLHSVSSNLNPSGALDRLLCVWS